MREIIGTTKSVRALLKGAKYSIDYYQREYKWQDKQIRELIEDLSDMFFEDFDPRHPRNKVSEYAHYFLGSIIISKKEAKNYIVDGQQRLTSVTLLLVLLRNLQKDRAVQVNVDDLIFSERYGSKSFNIQEDQKLILADQRTPVMEALYEERPFDIVGAPETAQNLVLRYRDLEACLPEALTADALPYFIDWLLDNVHFVEITAYSDEDAYTIFETMNDRGLSLSPTDMLKGYLLANVDEEKRLSASTSWRNRIRELNDAGKEVGPDFFKAWFRSQYANKIRERKKGAKAEDFDRIGVEFHRWLRDAANEIQLETNDDFFRFIDRNFAFYSRQYLRIVSATRSLDPGLHHIFYNGQQGFTLQHMLLLAPLTPDDDEATVTRKMALVARYIDILLNWRIWNFRSINYSTLQYAMFVVMRDIRRLAPDALAARLHEQLKRETETFSSSLGLFLHQLNRYPLHRMLARMTNYVETQSGLPSYYIDYVGEGPNRYEVEHIWANRPDRHRDEFSHNADFGSFRNRIGALLLLPKPFNASYGALPYEEKLPQYLSQNLLARSLHPQCYEHNPRFLQFVQRSGLPFKPHTQFKKADIEERTLLYQKLAEQIWNPDSLLNEGQA